MTHDEHQPNHRLEARTSLAVVRLGRYFAEGRMDKLPGVWSELGLILGVGDEFPIQLFANAGYAVFSFQKPPPQLGGGPAGTRSLQDTLAALNRNWADRRNIQSSLLGGIERILARGHIDRARIGITGSSDGWTSVQFALINSPGLFAAASVRSCCVEPTGMIYGGTGLADERARWGFPPATGPRLSEWKPVSLAMNTSIITAPLLMHVADHEYLIALETFMALHRDHHPVDLRIFPDEYHLKWQPAHRLAIYERNLDWFDFWLRGRESGAIGSEVRLQDILRWRAMRDDRAKDQAR